MPAYDPTAEADGEYIAAFAAQAGEVSPVFEKKVRNVFEQEIGGAEPDEWYAVADIVRAFEKIEDKAGERTLEQGGIATGKALPWPEGVDSVADGLATVNDLHLAAYRNSDADVPAGQFTFESVGDESARVGVTEGYPYPDAYARGALKGAVSDLTGSSPDVTETDTHGDERTAWRVEW
jgi:hypothetical protein